MVVIRLTIVIALTVWAYKWYVAKYRKVKERDEPDEKSQSLLENIGNKLSEAVPNLRRRKESEQDETLLKKGLDQLKNGEWQELQNTLTPTFVSSKMRSVSERISRCSKIFTCIKVTIVKANTFLLVPCLMKALCIGKVVAILIIIIVMIPIIVIPTVIIIKVL